VQAPPDLNAAFGYCDRSGYGLLLVTQAPPDLSTPLVTQALPDLSTLLGFIDLTGFSLPLAAVPSCSAVPPRSRRCYCFLLARISSGRVADLVLGFYSVAARVRTCSRSGAPA